MIVISKNWQRRIFRQNSYLPKFGQKGPKKSQKTGFFDLTKNCVIFLFGNWELWKYIKFLAFIWKPDVWENSRSWVIGENSFDQSDCRILELGYLLNYMRYQHDFLYIDKYPLNLQTDHGIIVGKFRRSCGGVTRLSFACPKCPKRTTIINIYSSGLAHYINLLHM